MPKNKLGSSVIKINTQPGSRVKTDADEITMVGVEQTSSGGTVLHKANKTLNQVGNTMNVEDGGVIINQSEGNLCQVGNEMAARSGGVISNKLPCLN